MPGIADLGCPDEIVQRHPMGLGDGQEQLEAGLALAGLEAREGALRDAGRCRERGQGDTPLVSEPPQPGTDFGEHCPRSRVESSIGRFSARFPEIATIGCRRAVATGILDAMTEFDVIVIGGGAAGLSAALVLTRARRSVLVIDSGMPRNQPAAHMHGFLSRDGMPPLELLAIGRDEVEGYGGTILPDTVTDVVNEGTSGFRVSLRDGRPVRARRLLIATGLRDEIPDIAGLWDRWGRDVLHCPYCHGFEVRDREARRARRLAAGSPVRVDRPAVDRRPHLPHAARQPDGQRARTTGCPGDHDRRGRRAAHHRSWRSSGRRRAGRRPGGSLRRAVRPAAIRPQQRPARQPGLRRRRRRLGDHRRPTGSRASPASGWRATSPIHAPRSSRPPAKDPPPPSRSTPTWSRRTSARRSEPPEQR